MNHYTEHQSARLSPAEVAPQARMFDWTLTKTPWRWPLCIEAQGLIRWQSRIAARFRTASMR